MRLIHKSINWNSVTRPPKGNIQTHEITNNQCQWNERNYKRMRDWMESQESIQTIRDGWGYYQDDRILTIYEWKKKQSAQNEEWMDDKKSES